MRNAEWGVGSAEWGVRNAECGVRSAGCPGEEFVRERNSFQIVHIATGLFAKC